MSVLLMRRRKIATKKEVHRSIFRPVGKSGENALPETTAKWCLDIEGERVTVSFSRDNMFVLINDEQICCTAYITDAGYDVDLLFAFKGVQGHIYSDVEGDFMMNYLFINDHLVAQEEYDPSRSSGQKKKVKSGDVPLPMKLYMEEEQNRSETHDIKK